MEPGAGDTPVTFDGAFGDAEGVGDFAFGESSEEAHFDDAALARVEVFEADEGLVDGEELIGIGVVVEEGLIDVDGRDARAAFLRTALARVIHK